MHFLLCLKSLLHFLPLDLSITSFGRILSTTCRQQHGKHSFVQPPFLDSWPRFSLRGTALSNYADLRLLPTLQQILLGRRCSGMWTVEGN